MPAWTPTKIFSAEVTAADSNFRFSDDVPAGGDGLLDTGNLDQAGANNYQGVFTALSGGKTNIRKMSNIFTDPAFFKFPDGYTAESSLLLSKFFVS